MAEAEQDRGAPPHTPQGDEVPLTPVKGVKGALPPCGCGRSPRSCPVTKLAVFYATVGTGHRAAAEALAEWCLAEYPGSEVLCRDLLDYVPGWIRRCVTGAYLFMARRAPWLWGRLYAATDRAVGPRWGASFWNGLHRAVSRVYLRRLMREIDAFGPSAILATHFFGMSALLDCWKQRTPIYYVGTDYISHAVQRDRRFDGWFVASGESVRQHRADGITFSESRVKNFGVPVARAYSDPPTRDEARRELGIGESAVSVLIAGGGIGAGALGAAADSLVPYVREEGWHVEILCGSNRGLYETLRARYSPFPNIAVREFIPNICGYYAASDVVVLKPGGLSSAEVAACGCAVLLLDPLPGQEQYNCDYLLERGAARRIYEVRSVGEQIAELLRRPEELAALRANAKALGRPGAAGEILRAVAGKPGAGAVTD